MLLSQSARARPTRELTFVHRMTGVKPPTNVPRDSTGNEQPAAYFEDDDIDDDDNNRDATLIRRSQQQQQQAPQPRSVKRTGTTNNNNYNREHSVPTKNPDNAGPRRVDRPDLYADIGERGR